jgi:hypothetical protein
MSGWDQLGDLIGGGLESRKETAFQNGRFRSAQTEDALTNARVNQAKAMQTEAENTARADFAAAQAAGGVDYTNPSSDMITHALLGGLAPDLAQAGKFTLGAQEYRNRDTLGSTTASAQTRARASDAVQGKYEGDLQAVGTKGYYNRTDDVPELSVMAGLADPTTTEADYAKVMELGGPDSPAGKIFMDLKRKNYQIVSDGGVPTQVRTGTQPTVTPLNTAAGTGNNAATITDAKTTAATQSKLRNALPGVVESLDTFRQGIKDFTEAPGFDMVYGKSGAAARVMGPVAPEEYRNAHVLLQNLKGEAFSNSVQKMRGLGSLSNAEGEKVMAALTAALDENQDEEQAAKSFQKLMERLDRFQRVAELEAGLKGTGVDVAPGLTPPQVNPGVSAPQEFATEEEAAKAGLAPGTKVKIGGVSGTWE